MASLGLDIFKKDIQGNPIWIDDSIGFHSSWRIFRFRLQIHQIVASLVRIGQDPAPFTATA